MARRPRYSLRDVERTLEKNRARLLAFANVLYLAVGEKIRADAGLGRLAIRVCVSRKRGPRYGRAVPRRLRAVRRDGTPAGFFIPTDVESRPPRLKALGLRGGDRLVGATLGSAGLVLFGRDGEPCVLTNAHVAPGVDRPAAGQAVRASGGAVVGHVGRATPLSSAPGRVHCVDAALVVPAVPVDPFAVDGEPSRVTRYGTLAHGSAPALFYLREGGARTGLHRPQRVVTARPVEVEGRTLLFSDFWELAVCSGPPPAPGDSGSVLLSDSGAGLVAHGLLFAGGGPIAAAAAIDAVFAALGEEGSGD